MADGSQAVSRRALLGGAAAAALCGTARAAAPDLPISKLTSSADAGDIVVLTPRQADYGRYQRYAAANARVALSPRARLLIRSAKGATAAVNWVRDNGLSFAIRGGGHCYEAFSQSASVVLDMRPLDTVTLASDGGSVEAGGGALLGEVYGALGAKGLVIPAGSCPPVGVAGHLQGGGYGFLARSLGLACDSLVGAELVDAKGAIRNVSATSTPDLFWALRGGGGGSFGLVTKFVFRTHSVDTTVRFTVTWGTLGARAAAAVLLAWQDWAPAAARELVPILLIAPAGGRRLSLRCFGISAKADARFVQGELARLTRQVGGSVLGLIPARFIDQTVHFSGSAQKLTGKLDDTRFFAPTLFKGSSDVIEQLLTRAGAEALTLAIATAGTVTAICDPYGGAIADVAPEATAFAHRAGRFSIQYYSEWRSNGDTAGRLAAVAHVRAAMRPHVTGAAYCNYCDLAIADYGTAYWGANFPKLKSMKRAYDPNNLFRHAQSIPV